MRNTIDNGSLEEMTEKKQVSNYKIAKNIISEGFRTFGRNVSKWIQGIYIAPTFKRKYSDSDYSKMLDFFGDDNSVAQTFSSTLISGLPHLLCFYVHTTLNMQIQHATQSSDTIEGLPIDPIGKLMLYSLSVLPVTQTLSHIYERFKEKRQTIKTN